MDNILLIFLNDLERVDEFNEIIDEFDKNGYAMYLLDNIKEDEYFSMDILPGMVENCKNEHKNVNKVVVLSNSRDLIFSWYRCYNSVVDDFVYFLDEDEKDYFLPSERHFDFYYNLYEFNGINKETIKGKIYLNINFDNKNKIFDFLIKNNNFTYFDDIKNFRYKEETHKITRKSKTYRFNKYEYSFDIDKGRVEKINILGNKQNNIVVDDLFIELILKNRYIIPYIIDEFYKLNNDMNTNVLLIIFRRLKELGKENYKSVYDELFSYINRNQVDFKEKTYISSLLVMIHGGDERLTEFIMQTLLEDEEYIEYHYEVITNIMFYSTNENIVKHDNFYLDLRNEIGKIANWVSNDERLKGFDCKIRKSNNKKIAIVVEQLMSIHHSPTKLMLDYARNIKKYYPDYEVKIFVEDILYCKNELGMIPYLYTSAISSSIKDEHYEYLSDKSIEICYANVNLSKKSRTINLANKVIEFNPEVILTNSDISVVSRIFYNRIPIVYMSMGGDYFSNLADAYLCVIKERVIEVNNKYGLLDENRLYEFKTGLEFAEPKKHIKRSDYSIGQNDFVMVTVGNRLDAEMDEEFIDYIVKFIMKNDDVRWVIVGPRHINYLQTKYDFLLDDKIIKIQYEDDLPALYRICDVYLNPRRKGGGISIAMAMNEELPVVLTMDSTDGVYYVGIGNAVNNSMEDYLELLNEFYVNICERSKISKKMLQIIELYSFENFTSNLMDLINMLNK